MTRSSEDLGDANFAHRRYEYLQLFDKVAHEVRELVHRPSDLNQGVLAFLVYSA